MERLADDMHAVARDRDILIESMSTRSTARVLAGYVATVSMLYAPLLCAYQIYYT
jgi:hypothetical protein